MQPARLIITEDSFKQQSSQTPNKKKKKTKSHKSNSFCRTGTNSRNKSAYGPAVITYSSPAHPHPTFHTGPYVPVWQRHVCMCGHSVASAECPLAFCCSVGCEQTAGELQLLEKIKTSQPDRDKVTLLRLSHPSVRHLPALLFPFSITQTAGCQAVGKSSGANIHKWQITAFFF